MSRVPVLVILGSTGTGKSRLGIELAKKFSGEVISADSMQVYKGLDIVTAKITKEEKLLAPHHMLDVVDPLVKHCVYDYRNMALPIVDQLLSENKIPVIVGGTNYYIEALLWKILVTTDQSEGQDSDSETNIIPLKKAKFEDEVSNAELHKQLMEVDPERARTLHPNNRRKVLRSLEIFHKSGMKHSEVLREQRLAGGCGLGGPLRYENSVLIWLRCDQKVLDERLDKRVDHMLESGLISELLDFHKRYNQHRIEINKSPDYTKGIFQTIGFKEFHNYLILSEEERKSEVGQKLLTESTNELKLVTRRYAKRQNKWIMNRIVRRTDRQVPPVYLLDCTNIDQWEKNVLSPAIEIVSAKLKGEEPSQKPMSEKMEDRKISDNSTDETNFCQVCNRMFIGELQWLAHINGNKHSRMERKKKKLANKVDPNKAQAQN